MKSLIALILALPLAAQAQDQYLCVADKATGFALQDGEWISTNFRTEDERYILRRATEEDNKFRTEPLSWVLVQLGESNSVTFCADDIDEYGWLNCPGFEELRFNVNSLRFQLYYAFGYVNGKDEEGDTPSITIGKCSAF